MCLYPSLHFPIPSFPISSVSGVIKCKKERGSSETCPQCSFPQTLNRTLLLGLTTEQLRCERPALYSPLKKWNNTLWAESECDLLYTRDFEEPLGQLTFVLSDSHGNHAQVACDVRHPGDSSPMSWTVNPQSLGELSVNVSLLTVLECEIDRETLQNLWQLIAYYYESPAILERGQQRSNTSRATYQYVQTLNENSPYFTELKGHLLAEPSWLLQPRVMLRLNRKLTTTKKLVMDFITLITKHINGQRQQDDFTFSWAMIRRGTGQQVQTALEGTKVHLLCTVITSDPEVKVKWILPDLTAVEDATDKIEMSERGELVILNATLSDSGLYHCMVRTKAGVDLMPLRLTIKERLLSPTAFNGQKVLLKKGQSFSLTCDVTSVQPSQIVWYLPKNQFLLPRQQTKRAEVMANGTLVLRKLTQEDSGEYSCLASNLYGVDMISHMVKVTRATSDRSKVDAERDQQILPIHMEEGEGSGVDYQEIARPIAKQIPTKTPTQQRNRTRLSKRIQIQNSKRKPNTSVNKLDPNHWAEILAKVNAKPSITPTGQSLEEPSTVTVHKPTTAANSGVSMSNKVLHITTSTYITTQPTQSSVNLKPKAEAHLTEKKKNQDILPQLLQPPPPRSTEPSHQHIGRPEYITVSPAAGTFQPLDQYIREGRRNHSFLPGQANRRRLPYRRWKPPLRTGINSHLNPFHNSSKKPQTMVHPTTTTTTPTSSTTTTTTTTTSSSTITASTIAPVAATVENHETLPNVYQPEEYEGEYYEEYNYKHNQSLDVKEDLNGETRHTSQDFYRSLTTSFVEKVPEIGPSPGTINLPSPKTIVTAKLESNPLPTESANMDVTHKEQKDKDSVSLSKSDRVEMRTDTEEKSRNNNSFAGEMEEKATDWRENPKILIGDGERNKELKKNHVSPSYNTQDSTRPLAEQSIKAQPRFPSSRVIHSFSNRARTKDVPPNQENEQNRTRVNPESQRFPIMESIHPWLHQHNQERGQTAMSHATQTNLEKKKGKQTAVTVGRHSEPPRVSPTSHWPSHHFHDRHHYNPIYHSWPGERTFHNRWKGKKSCSVTIINKK